MSCGVSSDGVYPLRRCCVSHVPQGTVRATVVEGTKDPLAPLLTALKWDAEALFQRLKSADENDKAQLDGIAR